MKCISINQYRPVYCRDNLDVFEEMIKNLCPILMYFDSEKGPVHTKEKLKELKWILQHYLIYWLFLWTAESTAIHLEYLILIWFVLGSYRCQNKFVIAINITSIMWVRKRSYIGRSLCSMRLINIAISEENKPFIRRTWCIRF